MNPSTVAPTNTDAVMISLLARLPDTTHPRRARITDRSLAGDGEIGRNTASAMLRLRPRRWQPTVERPDRLFQEIHEVIDACQARGRTWLFLEMRPTSQEPK